MDIKLKEIDKETLKVGDWVGISRKVSCGWGSSFRRQLITPAQITKITPKRTKFFTDKFGEHDKCEVFYVCDVNAGMETYLAKSFKDFSDGIYKLSELKREDRIRAISDEDMLEVAEHMKAITEILEKYKEK